MVMFDADGYAIDYDPLSDIDSLEIENVELPATDIKLNVVNPFDPDSETDIDPKEED